MENLGSGALIPGVHGSNLIFTGNVSIHNILIQLSQSGIIFPRKYLMTTKCVAIKADATVIYIMLLFHYHFQCPNFLMRFMSIQATVGKLGAQCLELLPAHAISRCDLVPMCHGIGKGKALKTVKDCKYSLS